MSEELFPSGPWVGFYNYHPRDRHRMDLDLIFAKGAINGDGHDDINRFLIKGRYDSTSLECHWTKSYVGAHEVFYHGFREGKGIWGTWEIGLFGRGGFHIWPRSESEGEQWQASSEKLEPIDAIGSLVTHSELSKHWIFAFISKRCFENSPTFQFQGWGRLAFVEKASHLVLHWNNLWLTAA
jgi:hypothetical protein